MERIAIIGISCLLPGARNPAEYWDNLRDGRDCRSDGADTILRHSFRGPDSLAGSSSEIVTTRGGFVRGFRFDPAGYRLPASLLDQLDDVFQWPIHTARAALVDSGYWNTPALERTGLVIGNYAFPTRLSNRLTLPLWYAAVADGLREAGIDTADCERRIGLDRALATRPENACVAGLPASIAASALGLGGVRYALDAACASALYSIRLAANHLATRQCDLMLAGGVCAPDPLLIHLSFSSLNAYPRNGVSQPFDARSGGILTGQGAGICVLKRLADALRDNDRIHAVIDGIGLSNDGAGRHVLTPNPRGQIKAYELAYRDAGVNPAEVAYIECHATGTPLGDSTEIDALDEFLSRHGARPLLGSVKGNIGHLLTVAGFSSLLKVVLAMRHRWIPPTATGQPIRSQGGLAGPHSIVSTGRDWPRDAGRHAAVSAFGFGGANAHMILSPPPEPGAAHDPTPAAPARIPRADICGIGCHFGPFPDRRELERAIFTGASGKRALPAARWRGFEQSDKLRQSFELPGNAPGAGSIEAAFIEGFSFDALAARIPPAELASFNRQHLLMMRTANEALNDAGFTCEGRDRPARHVAVVFAMEIEPSTHGHRARFDLDEFIGSGLRRAGRPLDEARERELKRIARASIHPGIQPNEVLSYIGNIMASRVSSQWNFTGPSFTLSADRNSGLYAVDVARLLLMDPEIEAVVVGAVDLACNAETMLTGGRKSHMAGEGAAALVLRRSQANSKAYATIEASATVHAPAEPHSVAAAISSALAEAGRAPADVALYATDLFECSDSAAAALSGVPQALGGMSNGPSCALASISGNIGDTHIAGGIARLVHAALCIHHAHLPPLAEHSGADRDRAALLEGSPFHAPRHATPWLRDSNRTPRVALAGASSETGDYSCVVLSAARLSGAEGSGAEPRAASCGFRPFTAPRFHAFAGRDVADLTRQIENFRAAASNGRIPVPPDAAALRALSLAGGGELPVRAVLMAAAETELLREAERALQGIAEAARTGADWSTPAGSCFSGRPIGPDGKIAFVYPGGFNSYIGMGHDLFLAFPELLEHFEQQAPRPADLFRARQLYPRSLRRLENRDLARLESRLMDDIPFMLATGTTFAMLYTDAWRGAFGVHPHGAFGYSLGESSMLFSLGVWDSAARDDSKISGTPLFRDGLCGERRIVREAWGVPASAPAAQVWSSFVALCPADRAIEAVKSYERVFVTHVNTPNEVVVAGDPRQCGRLIASLKCQSARLPQHPVMHCAMAAGVVDELAWLNHYPARRVDGVEVFSTFEYGAVSHFDADTIAAHIGQTLIRPVDFDRLVRTAYARGYRYFIETGAGAACTRWIDDILAKQPHVAAASDRRNQPVASSLLRVAGRLFCHGVPLDLSRFQAPDRIQTAPGFHVTCGGEPVPAFIASRVRALPEPETEPVTQPETQFISHEVLHSMDAIEIFESASAPVASQTIVYDAEPVEETAPACLAPAVLAPAVPATTAAGVNGSGGGQSGGNDVRQTISQICAQSIAAHRAFLHLNENVTARMLLALEGKESCAPSQTGPYTPSPPRVHPRVPVPDPPVPSPAPSAGVLWDENQLLEFATGSVAQVFGPDFAPIDGFGKRVRLPAPPYLFVTRVTKLEGVPRRLEAASIHTEYDIPAGGWFALDGQTPPAVTIEAGQCDLLLISWLGIDFQNRGERVYRLLDSTLVFKGDLPRAGQTLRYEIRIKSFVRNGAQTLFFFGYECYADNKLILVLEDACAGFFSEKELNHSLGVVIADREKAERAGAEKKFFKPLCSTDRTSLSRADIAKLAGGSIADVFGREYDQGDANPSLRLPANDLLMIDRVTRMDRTGGPWGLGAIEAEKDLEPGAWYFKCHFSDDPVLAGSMVAEGAVQILQVYALALGLQMCLPDARFQPVPDLRTSVKVRGQITPSCRRIRYRVEVQDISLLPRPQIVADVLVFDGDKPVIGIRNLGIAIREKEDAPYRPAENGVVKHFLGRRNREGQAAMLNEFHMAHASKGDLGVAMGPEFDVYRTRRAPYIPNGDFLFVDRVMALEGERGKPRRGSVMITEYDSPAQGWYYRDNSSPSMPNCVLMETSLQSAILLGYYLGATLNNPNEEFSIRNLDGSATLLRDIDLRGRTIRHKETLLSTNAMSGSILQNFSYELSTGGEAFYKGESLFGYFTALALANQVGLDQGRFVEPWLHTQKEAWSSACLVDMNRAPELFDPRSNPQGLALARNRLKLVDTVEIVPSGGRRGLGYGLGTRTIRPEDWYFNCHFHRDPVMPGSLGVEAIIQGVQTWILRRNLAANFGPSRFALAAGISMSWKYRGQILRENPEMFFDFEITDIKREPGRLVVVCDANLWKTGMRIYEIANLAVAVVETAGKEERK